MHSEYEYLIQLFHTTVSLIVIYGDTHYLALLNQISYAFKELMSGASAELSREIAVYINECDYYVERYRE